MSSTDREYRHKRLQEDEDDDELYDSAAARMIRKNRRKNNLKFLIGISIVSILIIIATIILYFVLHKSNKTTHICISPDVCNSNLLDYIDASHDPCDNFFAYSCGNWLARNPLSGRDGVSIFGALFRDNYVHLRDYLSSPVQETDQAAIKKSKYIYSSCANVDYIKSQFKEHVQEFMRNAGGWEDIGITPDHGWDINGSLANDHYLGSSALFSFGVSSDDLNSSMPVIRISQAGLTLDSPQAYNTSDFEDLVAKITKTLEGFGDGDFVDLAKSIATFEQSLASAWLTDTELRNVSALYNPMTLEQLQSNLFNMDWVGYFNKIFSKAGVATETFTSNTRVIVDTPTYFENVHRIISNKWTSFINYARWQLLLSEFLVATASLESSWTTMHERRFPQSSKLSQSASFACVELAEAAMPLAVARPFVDELINKSTTIKVSDAISEIKAAFVESLMEKNWLDNVTKDGCRDKVNALTSQIAYPSFIEIDSELNQYYDRVREALIDVYDETFLSLQINSSLNHFQIVKAIREFTYHQKFSAYTRPIDKTEWLIPPTQVNAYYAPEFNQIVFLAGILRPPFFALNYPPFLLYGGLGAVIGHELTHGYDDQGQQYNKYGNRVPWWTDKSTENFKNLTKCFVNQYGDYSLQGFQIDGELTLGENIADNGGLRTAFRAYMNVMNGSTEGQPLIHGHTIDQLFFVAFAQLWCSRFSDDHLKTSVQTDPHSPGELRVFGTLVNNGDFSTAFNCSKKSTMNPPRKCQLW